MCLSEMDRIIQFPASSGGRTGRALETRAPSIILNMKSEYKVIYLQWPDIGYGLTI